MKILVHTCCGPCLIHPSEKLEQQGFDLTSLVYNPNIHPYTEYLIRRDALLTYAKNRSISVIERSYEYHKYLNQVTIDPQDRCRRCYEVRMSRAAEEAARGGYDRFTTTLLVSPYQKHELIKETGEKLAERYGIEFHYDDYRPGFRDAQQQAKDLGMYRQRYCGCIYSMKERFEVKR